MKKQIYFSHHPLFSSHLLHTISLYTETRVHLAAARPILACGGSFELEVRDPPSIRSDEGATTTANTMIQVRVSSSDPDHTAKEIGRRLWVRYWNVNYNGLSNKPFCSIE